MTTVSARPYFIRAVYEWLVDSELTPHILVNTSDPDVCIPKQYLNHESQIVLNIAPMAVIHLLMDNEAISFDARFSGVSHSLYIPIRCVKGIYAYEDGRGMAFNEQPDDRDGAAGISAVITGHASLHSTSSSPSQSTSNSTRPTDPNSKGGKKGPPKLTVVK